MGGSGGGGSKWNPISAVVAPVVSTALDLSKGIVNTATELVTQKEAKKAKRAAEDAMNRQTEEGNRLSQEARDRQANEESAAANAAAQAQARARQRALSAGAQGRNSTILTSPLGITDEAEGQPDLKNLLGL